MFKDESFEPIEILSDTREEKFVRDQLCQTKDLKQSTKACQVIERNEIEIQTDFEQSLPQATRLKIDNSKHLSEFVKKVFPLISEQLTANIRSHAFDNYDVDWDDDNTSNETECKQTLCYKDVPEQRVVTSLSWNSVGSVIAVALGSHDHQSWCVHQSFLCLWNIDRGSIDVDKPDTIIDTDSCLMTICFHRKQTSLLVGGDFSGTVYVWDFSQPDTFLVVTSTKETVSHQEPITKVVWTESKSSRSHQFVSVGRDGKILVWEFNQLKKELKLVHNFLLESGRRGGKRSSPVGITCMSLMPNFYDFILLGTENGNIYKCSIKGDKISSEVCMLVTTQFTGHPVSVTSIDANYAVVGIFMTCALDSTVHVYDVKVQSPIMVIEPICALLTGCCWSTSRSTVFYLATSNGELIVFDLAQNAITSSSVLTIHKGNSATVLSLNASQSNLFASGSDKGEIKLWTLPHHLLQERNEESLFFKNLQSQE